MKNKYKKLQTSFSLSVDFIITSEGHTCFCLRFTCLFTRFVCRSTLSQTPKTQKYVIGILDPQCRVARSLYRKRRHTMNLLQDHFLLTCNSSSARDIWSGVSTRNGSRVVSLDEYRFTGIHPVYTKEDFSAQIKPSSCLYIPHHAIFWWKISRDLNVIRADLKSICSSVSIELSNPP